MFRISGISQHTFEKTGPTNKEDAASILGHAPNHDRRADLPSALGR